VPLAITARTLLPHIAVTRIAELIAVAVIVGFSLWHAGPNAPPRALEELRHPWRAPELPSRSRTESHSLEV
jgi:hypothetical protein